MQAKTFLYVGVLLSINISLRASNFDIFYYLKSIYITFFTTNYWHWSFFFPYLNMLVIYVLLVLHAATAHNHHHHRKEKIYYAKADAWFHFQWFMETHNKAYHESEEASRFKIFQENLVKINEMNRRDPHCAFGELTSNLLAYPYEFKTLK